MSVYKEIQHIVPVGYQGGFAVDANGEHAFYGNNRVVTIQLQGTGTIRVFASNQKEKVDFTIASSPTNLYSQVALYDYALVVNNLVSTVSVAGSTAFVEINVNQLTWFAIEATSGAPALSINITDNQ